MKARVEKFRWWMENQGVDVAIALKPHDVLYLSGSAPVCSGLLIFREFPPVQVCIWLDGSEVKKDSHLQRVVGYQFPEYSLAEKMAGLIQERLKSPRTIGIEDDGLSPPDWGNSGGGPDCDPRGRLCQALPASSGPVRLEGRINPWWEEASVRG